MRNLIIDERIRDVEYSYLKQYFNVIKLPVSNDVYEEISGHSDIFYFSLNGKIICAPNAPFIDSTFIVGNSVVQNKYPFDVPYNACKIGDRIIGSKYTDSLIKTDIVVKQGYTKCSIAVTSNNSCITTDEGIAKKLTSIGIDVLYIKEENIKLLKENSFSEKCGFIGGATLCFENKFVVFGDSENLAYKTEVMEHLKKHGLEMVEFKELPIIDYGSGVIY